MVMVNSYRSIRSLSLNCSKDILRGPSSKVKSQSSFRKENSTFSFLIVIINTYGVCPCENSRFSSPFAAEDVSRGRLVCRILGFYKSEKSGQSAPSFCGQEGGIYGGFPRCFSTELLGSI